MKILGKFGFVVFFAVGLGVSSPAQDAEPVETEGGGKADPFADTSGYGASVGAISAERASRVTATVLVRLDVFETDARLKLAELDAKAKDAPRAKVAAGDPAKTMR